MARLLAVLTLLLCASCTSKNPAYCEDSTDCDDPAAPFCDVDGSEAGAANTCIAEPAGDPDAGAAPDASPPPPDAALPSARLRAEWDLMARGMSASCGDVNVGTVSLLSTSVGPGPILEDVFDCTTGVGTTAPMPLGDYQVVLRLLEEASGDVLMASEPRDVALMSDGETVVLAPFSFGFEVPGDVTFTVDYGAADGSNCSGGAGGEVVENQRTTLVPSGTAMCVPTSLTAPGTAGAANICTELPPCIERDIEQTLLDVLPGNYDLTIEGTFFNGSTITCFRQTMGITVEGDQSLGVLIIPFTDADDPTFCSTI